MRSGLGSEQRVRSFFDAYRAAFERYDAAAIADLFAYPGHVTSDAGEVGLIPVTSRDTWIAQLERLLAMYGALDVGSAQLLDLHVVELSPRLLQASGHWGLRDRTGAALYDFQATYTLVERDDALRISAIAHNEVPRYRACVARLRALRAQESAGPERKGG